jgi:hypothetical protein
MDKHLDALLGVATTQEAATALEAIRGEMIDLKAYRSDWQRAHELLDRAGVLTAKPHEMGVHLLDRLAALRSVWEPIGRLSAASCHDLRFLCNTPNECIEAIAAHRKAFRVLDPKEAS